MRTAPLGALIPERFQASGHEVLPLGQCGRAALLVGLPVDEVAFGIEMTVEGGVTRGELL